MGLHFCRGPRGAASWPHRQVVRTCSSARSHWRDPYCLLLEPSDTRTRLVLTQGPREGLRAVLPPLTHVRHGRAVMTLLDGLALWLDAPVRVALCAGASGTTYWLGLTDARGSGTCGLASRGATPRDKRQAGQVHALDDWEVGPEGGRP